MRRSLRGLLVGILGAAGLAASTLWASNRPIRWLVFYGKELPARHVRSLDLAILDPDNIAAKTLRSKAKSGAKFLGYLSVGEASRERETWAEVEGKGFLVEENPVWKGAWRVDIRSKVWQTLLRDRIVPAILKKGYDGLFLDTVDTAAYLEEKDPKKFHASREAMIGFIRSLRRKYPKAMIVPNNGLEILDAIAQDVDGVVVEDLYTRYDFEKKASVKTPGEVTTSKEAVLDRFRRTTGKPVFNILYAPSLDSPIAKEGIRRSESKGYQWYVAPIDLMTVGNIAR